MSRIHIHAGAALAPVQFVTGSSRRPVQSKHGALQSPIELLPQILNSLIGQEGKLLAACLHTTFVECDIFLHNWSREGISLAPLIRVAAAIDSAHCKSSGATSSAVATTDWPNQSLWAFTKNDQRCYADAKAGIQHSRQVWL